MDFISAVQELIPGDRMSKPDLLPDYISVSKSKLMLFRHGDYGTSVYCPSVEDICSLEWELMEEFGE